jgi:L-cysteine desulfidase
MHELTQLIKADMKPALGVTEPGAIAFAVSTAREHLKEPVKKVHLYLNSGIYKNAFTCGIPGTRHIGNEYAAALGVIKANPEKGLLCLEGIGDDDIRQAEALVRSGVIDVHMTEMTSRIHIEARLEGDHHRAEVVVKDAHTNIVRIREDGKTVFSAETAEAEAGTENVPLIHRYTVQQLLGYVSTVPLEEISFIREAVVMNMDLCREGIENGQTTFARTLLAMNGGQLFSDDPLRTANLICNAAIEARVIGLDKPAMSITGSGAHGIIATLPLYAWAKVRKEGEDVLLRSIALSYLICMYIKEYSGKLSAFCGCAIAAGTGAACGLVYLMGGGEKELQKAISNMASSITGMICDGGNQGCVMKGITAVELSFTSAKLAMQDAYIFPEHGINGATPEETMRNMGLIASPGMVATERTIVEILQDKDRKKKQE